MFNNSSHINISGGVFNNTTQSQLSGFQQLAKRAVLSATHDSGESFDGPRCLENTRVAILKRLKDWFLGEAESESIMWLYGDAGAGKSAIAQTLAEVFAREKRLLGSFFFSRNDEHRATHNPLIATIAYHAATTIPELAEAIVSVVDRDPRIFDKTLQTQLTTLIIDPLNTIRTCSSHPRKVIPHFLIIDGLDECTDRRIHRQILKVLSEAVRKCYHPLKVLVASRPETEILLTFNSHVLSGASTRLALDASEFESENDIYFLLESTFKKIKATHPHRSFIPLSWPSHDVLEQLVQKSSGKFIFASTVAKYICSERHEPVERLKIILGLKHPSSDDDLPFAELDALYIYIFSTIPKENLDIVLFILGLLIFPFWPNSPQLTPFSFNKMWAIEAFLSLRFGNLEFLLGHLSSVLKWDARPNYESGGIWFTHASVTDFLLDPRRSKKFHIGQPEFSTQMARTCVRRLNIGMDSASQSPSYPITEEKLTMSYSFEMLPSFLERASLTPDLREDFSTFSLMSTFQWFQSSWTYRNFVFLESALRFVCILRGLSNAQDLFSYHQKEFDACMLSVLQKHSPGHEIITTTLIGLTHPWSKTAESRYTYPSLPHPSLFELEELFLPDLTPHLCTSSPSSCRFHRDIFLLTMLGGPFSSPQKVQWMLQFFSDTSRSKGYALSGKRYAAASLVFLMNICQEKFYKAVHPFEIALKDKIRTLYLTCAYIPQLLVRSSATTELITFLRGGRFECIYANYNPHSLETGRFYNFEMEELIPNVLKAIQNYLERCDPMGVPENQKLGLGAANAKRKVQ